jgi:hypothetical protein
MQDHDPFVLALFQSSCPSCAHRVLFHRFSRCGELTGPIAMKQVDDGFEVLLGACGCEALRCACGHSITEHGVDGCQHRTRDVYDLGERDCDCRNSNLAIWDLAVEGLRIAEKQALSKRALESLHATLAQGVIMIDLLTKALGDAETANPSELLTLARVVKDVESQAGRNQSDDALDVLQAYGILLTRLWSGPMLRDESAVTRAFRLATAGTQP